MIKRSDTFWGYNIIRKKVLMLIGTIIKYNAILVLMIIVTSISGYGQDFVYPLEVGTKWVWYLNSNPTGTTTQILLFDTTMPNSNKYSFITPGLFPDCATDGKYERKVSNRIYRYRRLYDTEMVYFDFSKHVGDTVNKDPNMILIHIGTTTLFGLSRRTYGFFFNPIPDGFDDEIYYRVADSIGVYEIGYYDETWRLKGAQIGDRIFGTITDVTNATTTILNGFSLLPAYPNPFNPSTQITYSLPRAADVILKIYDLLGREVALLVNERKPAGEHTVSWDAAGIPTGVYFYRLIAGEFVETKKMVVIK